MTRAMKDSGIEWIGEIPEDWNVVPIGHLYSERKQKVSDTVYKPLSVTKQGIVPQLDSAAKSDAHDDRKLVCVGDFAINSRSDRRGSCGISDYEGSISLINTVLRPKTTMTPKYFDWLFHTTMFADEFYKWGHGIVDDLWTTNWSDMKKIMVALPSLPEQQKIADFLDEKCSHIDAVLEKTRASIEEYKQLKQSVITKAVTKGIRPNRPMKDSGIEWIGQIPDDWSTPKLKHLANLFGRIGFRGYKAEDLVEEGQGAITLSPSNFHDMQMDYSKLTYLSWFKYNESPEIMAFDNDIIFVKTGSTYGKSALITNLPCEATINPQNLLIKDVKTNIKYLLYYLNSEYTNYQVEQTVVGGTIPTIAQSKIENYYVLKPPMQEQKEIVTYLDTKCAEIDKLIKKKEQLIEELETYKKSLIYEYVTGKKEVC